MKKNRKSVTAALLIGLLTFAAVYFQWFAGLNLSLQDAVYQRENAADPAIKIIAIDEKTLSSLGQFENWTREPYARLIELLNQGDYAPKAIGLDILLVSEKGPQDVLLVEACKKYKNVVMASNLVFSARIETKDGKSQVNPLHIDMVETPFGELSELAAVGFVNTVQDARDNSVRYTLLEREGHISFASAIVRTAVGNAGEDITSGSTIADTEADGTTADTEADSAAADGTAADSAEADSAAADGTTADTEADSAAADGTAADAEADNTAAESVAAELPTDANNGIFIDYTGAPGTYETLSMIDVLEGKIPAAAFADSIVLVGAHAAGMGDSYAVPVQKGTQMYGVEIHANIVQSLLEGRCLVNMNPFPNALGCAILAFALTLLSVRMKIWASFMLAAGLIAAQYGLCLKLDEKGIVINVLILPLAALLAIVWSIISKYASEALQKRKIMHAFRKYVAPQVVEEIAKNQDYQLKLGGEKRHIAVLFVDIRGFTPLSEALEPEQVVEILNEYLGLVTDAIFKNGGTLDKFIGDAAMAVFNAPFDSEDYVYKAACAARDIAAGSDRIAATFMERFGKKVSYGIGVNCGDAVVGNIGSDFRMDYTAIGDTVNTAARLEANAKAGQILISEYVYEKLGERIQVTEIGAIPLKGKSREIMVYALDELS